MSVTDDLLSELTSVGRIESEGEFSLDRDKARQKMRRFQLADPRSYVLELVQAATLKGATTIRFDIDPVEMVMAFDGQPFTLEDFDDIYSAVFTRRRDRPVLARKQLALGLNAAMALEPVSITVTSGDGTGRGARLTLLPGEAAHDAFEAVDTELAGTRIALRERFRAGVVVDFFKNLAGEVAEEHHLRRQCVFSQVAIDLEGRRVDRGLHVPAGVIDEVPIEADGIRGVCGFTLNRSAPAGVHLVKDGVWITTVARPALSRGFVAVVEGRDLVKDVSQTGIVQDDALARIMRTVDRAWSDALARLCDRLVGAEPAPDWVHDELLAVLATHGGSMVFPVEGGATPFIQSVRQVPLWTSTRNEPVTIDAMVAEIQAAGSLGIVRSDGGYMGLLPEGRSLVVRLADTARRDAVHAIFGAQVADVLKVLQRLTRRETNRQIWLERPTELTLPAGRWLARSPVQTVAGVVGEVGVTTETTPLTLTLVKDGCTLDEISSPDVLVGLSAVIQADFAPTDMFDGVQRDATLAAALVAIAAELSGLYERAVVSGDLAPTAAASLLTCVTDYAGRLDAMLCKLAGLDLDSVDVERPAPFDLGLDGESPHALARQVMFECTDDTWMPLVEVASIVRNEGAVAVTARYRDEPELRAVVLDEVSHRLLTRLFGESALRDVSDEIAASQARRAFMGRRQIPIDLEPDGHSAIEHAEAGAVRAVVRVPLATGGRVAPYQVVVCHHQRPIARVPIVAIEGFQALVDASDLTPRPDYDGVEPDAALLRALEAVGQAFANGVARVAADPDQVADPQVAASLRSIAAMVFPSTRVRTRYERTFDGVVADALFERALEIVAAGEDLDERVRIKDGGLQSQDAFERAVEGFTARPTTRVLLDALFPPSARRSSGKRWQQRAVSPIPALAEAPLYRWTSGEATTIAELEHKARVMLRYLTEAPPVDLDTPILLVGERDLAELQRILGTSRLSSGQILVDRAINARRLETTRPLERLELEAGRALVTVALDDGAGMTGQVGLAVRHSGDALASRPVSLVLCRERRPVGERTVEDRASVGLLAIVDDARITLRYDMSDIVTNDAFERVVEQCLGCVPALASALVAQMSGLDSETWRHARRHLLDIVVPQLSGDIAGWPDRLERTPWLREACEVPLVPIAGGEFVSLRALWDLLWQHEELGVTEPVPDWQTPPPGLPMPVVVVDTWMRSCLESLFTSLTDVSTMWTELRRGLRMRAQLPDYAPWRDDQVIVRLAIDDEGLRGELVIPRDLTGDWNAVDLLVYGKRVDTIVVHQLLAVAGHLEGEAVKNERDLSGAHLDHRVAVRLDGRVCQLYTLLAEHLERTDDDDARKLLASVAITMRQELLRGALATRERQLYRRLHELPLLGMRGGHVSVATALSERFPELAHLGLWKPRPPSGTSHRFDIDAMREQLRRADDSSGDTPVVSGRDSSDALPVVEREPEPEPPSPEDRLVEALRQQLRLVRRHNRQLLDELHLERIAVRRGRAQAAARMQSGTVVLDSAHPAVLAALAHGGDDVVWLRLVASSVYTALNIAHTEITDSHECHFHRLLTSS